MTEDFQKVKPVEYNFGNGNSLKMVPTANGFQCWGYIAGEHVQFEDKDLPAMEVKIVNSLTKLNIDYMNKAIKLEEIALRIKEGGLEKFAQRDDDHKTDLNWIKQ